MRVTIRATYAGTVGDFDKTKPYLQLADLSQDVEAIKEHFGNRPAVEKFDGFLTNVEDGEYSEVYGFEGNIAYTWKPVYKITQTFTESKPKSTSKRAKSRRGAGNLVSVRRVGR